MPTWLHKRYDIRNIRHEDSSLQLKLAALGLSLVLFLVLVLLFLLILLSTHQLVLWGLVGIQLFAA